MIKIITLFFILTTVPIYAGDGFGGHVEFGRDTFSTMCYTDIKIKYDFTFYNFHLIPYGNQITWFYNDLKNIRKGFPFRDVYIVGTEIKYKSIIFGAEHFCSHAVSSGEQMYRMPDEPPLAYNFTKAFIRYEF